MSRFFIGTVNVNIDDSITSTDSLWSSSKTQQEINSGYDKSVTDLTTIINNLKLDQLSNVDTTGVQDKYVLQYNSNLNKYTVNKLDLTTSLTELDDVDLTGIEDKWLLQYNSLTNKFKAIKMLNITDLDDVNSNNLTDKSVLQYNLENNKFETVSMFALGDLLNVDLTGLNDNYTIVYSTEQRKFICTPFVTKSRLKELLDVDFTDITDKSFVYYSASVDKFLAKKPTTSDLDDVVLTGLKEGYVLSYNSTLQKFVPSEGGTGSGTINNNIYNTYVNNTIQVDKIGVIASKDNPKIVSINIPYTDNFNFGKLEVLKLENTTNEVENNFIAGFDNSDSSNFDYNVESVIFDGHMRINIGYIAKATVIENNNLPEGSKLVSFYLDPTKINFDKVSEIKLDY